MGSPLGPTFADFYMSHLENNILNNNNSFNPKFYSRYVDDTFVIFNDSSHLDPFIQALKSNSVLNFTFEIP